MKGKHLVIGLVLFVILVIGLIYLLMMNTINDIKDEMEKEEAVAIVVDHDEFLDFHAGRF